MNNKQTQSLQTKLNQSMVMTASLQNSLKILQLQANVLQELIYAEIEQNPFLYEGEKSNTPSSNYHSIENVAHEVSLKRFIFDQINLTISSKKQRLIAIHLTDSLDENGYLKCDLDILAQNLNINIKKITEVLNILQTLEPAGIFARTLSECIKLQLIERNIFNPEFALLLDNLELLANKNFKQLLEITNTTPDFLNHMITEIKKSNPKPGADFVKEPSGHCDPDIFLKIKDNKIILELNNDLLPKVLVDQTYYNEIELNKLGALDTKFIKEKFSNANFFVKAINQRAETMLKVASEIVNAQREFFEYGIFFLKPLTLKDIGNKLSMHESTISRVVSNKYIATEFGNFELKYFFSSKLNEVTSSTTIKYLIKDIITNEKLDNHSDEYIVSVLKLRNIDIARRTVAKYREEMHIPASSKRKEFKRKIDC